MILTLYKQDSSGDIRRWKVETQDGKITTTSSKLGGQEVTHTKVVKGKNIGKANETSAGAQAILEAKAMAEKKENEGYRGSVESARNAAKMLRTPMLAKQFIDYENKIVYPVIGQPKLNGMRCIAYKENGVTILESRLGNAISLPLIADAAGRLIDELNCNFLDGELYIHGTPLQDIISYIKTPSIFSTQLQYFVYDYHKDNIKQLERAKTLKMTSSFFHESSLARVPSILLYSRDSIQMYFEKRIETGFEGIMIRNVHATYQMKRTKDLLKLKKLFDGEFEIVDINDTRDNPGIPLFTLKNDLNTETFECVIKGTEGYRRELYRDRYKLIGKKLTVEYRDRTNKGVPSHAVGIAIRDYE